MLQDKYLPKWDIQSRESILISSDASLIYPLLLKLDFSRSTIVRWLFRLRGMPTEALNMQGLGGIRFHLLEEKPEQELILGVIGKFWTLKGHLLKFTREEFLEKTFNGYAKAGWNFHLSAVSENETLVETETRVCCVDKINTLKFRIYWFFISRFSSLIRKEILKCIKAQAEELQTKKFAVADKMQT